MGLDAEIELYASPFNHSLAVFCSPFDLDRVYGSLGSVYKIDWARVFAERFGCKKLSVVANPPYIESEIESCAEAIHHLTHTEAYRDYLNCVVSVCPAWYGAKGIEKLQRMEFKVFEKELPARAHGYYNYQSLKWISASFSSIGFAFSPASSASDAELEKMVGEVFASLKCAGDTGERCGVKRRRV